MRLIDADLFMGKLLSMKRSNKELPLLDDDPEVNNYDVGQEETFDLVIRKLSEQPTVDTRTPMANIVEKLEELKKDNTNGCEKVNQELCNSYLDCGLCLIDRIINIVKQEINNGLE